MKAVSSHTQEPELPLVIASFFRKIRALRPKEIALIIRVLDALPEVPDDTQPDSGLLSTELVQRIQFQSGRVYSKMEVCDMFQHHCGWGFATKNGYRFLRTKLGTQAVEAFWKYQKRYLEFRDIPKEEGPLAIRTIFNPKDIPPHLAVIK